MSNYNTKSLQDRLNSTAPEDGGVGTAGLYRHPLSGEEMHTLSDPLFGEAQSNAAERLGFVRVRDSKPTEIKHLDIATVAAATTQSDTLAGITARLNQLEGVAADNKRLEAELESLRKANESGNTTDSAAVAISGQTAKQDAIDQVDDRGQGDASKDATVAPLDPLGDADPIDGSVESLEDSADAANKVGLTGDEVEAVSTDMTAQELKAVADAEEVDLTGANTKDAIVEAINAKRLANNKEEEKE